MDEQRNKQKSFRKWILRPQMLVGLSALLLSVCGLFIAIYEATLIRQTQRASVWPYMEVSASIRDSAVRIWVRNTGIGPARIRAAKVTYKGEVQANWSAAIARLTGEKSPDVNFYKSLISGRVFPANSDPESIFVVSADSGTVEQEFVLLVGQAILAGDLDVTVCFCSVYDECWSSSLKDVVSRTRDLEIPESPEESEGCDIKERSRI